MTDDLADIDRIILEAQHSYVTALENKYGSPYDIAKKFPIDPSTLYLWKNGTREIKISTAISLEKHLREKEINFLAYLEKANDAFAQEMLSQI